MAQQNINSVQDGKAMVWDTNRLRYIRTLQTPHGEPMVYSAISEADVSTACAWRCYDG